MGNLERSKRRDRLVKANSMYKEGLINQEQFETIKSQTLGLDLTESEEQKQKGEEERRKKLEDQQAKEAAAAEAHRRTVEQQKRLEAKNEELNALVESMKVR